MAAPHPLSDVRQTAGKSAPPIFLGLAPHSGRAVQRAKPLNHFNGFPPHRSMSALPRKRTLVAAPIMSAKCQQQTHADGARSARILAGKLLLWRRRLTGAINRSGGYKKYQKRVCW